MRTVVYKYTEIERERDLHKERHTNDTKLEDFQKIWVIRIQTRNILL